MKLNDWFRNTVSSSRKGIEDVVVSMVPQFVTVIAGFVTSVLIARGLGPEGMGNYALILSVSGLVAGLSDLGIGQTAIRYASRAVSKDDTESQLAILRWAFRIRMMLVFLTSVIVFLVIPNVASGMWNAQHLTPLVRLSLLTGIFAAIASIPTIYFLSLKRFKMNAIVTIGQTLVLLTGIFIIAVMKAWSLEKVIVVSVLATGFGAFAFTVLVPKASFAVREEFHLPLWRAVRRLIFAPKKDATSLETTGANTFAYYMLLSSVFVTLTMRADIWLMGYYLDKSQVGLYSVASRFALPLTIVLGALNTALWPRASALTSMQSIMELFKKTFRLSLITAAGGVVYSLAVPMLTPILFGEAYGSGVLLGQVLCLRYCLAILICPLGVIGYSFGMVRIYWWINFIQLFVVIVTSIALLPRIGVLGSAVSLIANEIVGITLVGTLVWRKIRSLRDYS